jgi:DNA repair protein RecO (recombination protein O)
VAHIKARGFILREVPVGEADRILNVLTADLGLITASARGARRPKSALLMATQVYSLSEFELFANKGHFSVNTAELVEPFLALQQDLDRLICAAHLAEVMLDACRDDVPQPELYRLWAFSLQAIQSQPDPLLAVHIAQLRLLAEIGFSPRLDSCVACGNPLDHTTDNGAPALAFSVRSCGVICGRPGCRRPDDDARPMSAGTLNALRHALEAPLPRLFNGQLSPETRSAFIQISSHYLVHQMEKAYTKLKMLQRLDELTAPADSPPQPV